jgi:hypothetical protein
VLTDDVTGLTNGTAYTFTVKATNLIGTGPASAASNSVTPTAAATAPGAPTIGTATAGNASATVKWTAPASNGGSPITGYVITPFIGATAQTPIDVGNVLTDDVTGLTNGTAYTFTVKATNLIGTGPASAASNSVTPTAGGLVAPIITSATSATFTSGSPGTFKFLASGSPTPTFSEIGKLPSGVALSAGGVLTGTPAIATNGIYPITVTAANGVAPDATQSFILYVGLLVTTSSLPVAYVGPYSATLHAIGGNPPYKWARFGTLPPGLHLNKATGVISGTPKAAGTYTFTVRVTDTKTKTKPATQHIATKVLSITVAYSDAPAITSAAGTEFAVGFSDSFTVTTLGLPTPKLHETGALPSGVSFTDNGNGTGQLSGTPATGTIGTYPITITASNGKSPNATQSFRLTIEGAPSIISANKAIFTAGLPGRFSFLADGSPAPTFTESGALPSGVTLSGDGTLAGTPAVGTNGIYPITVTAANGIVPDATQSFILYVGLLVTTSSLPAGSVKVEYSTTMHAVGGLTPYKWTLFGSLPPGLHLNKGSGVISGKPKVAGTFSFTVQVVDTKSHTTPPTQHSATRVLSITIR